MITRRLFLATSAFAVTAITAGAQQSEEYHCLMTETGRLECTEPERPKLPPWLGDRHFFDGGALADSARPSRLFAGPDQYPPQEFRGYGILAFPSRASQFDQDRHEMICAAYISSLPYTASLDEPRKDQFVTIWPVETEEDAQSLRGLPALEVCPKAIAAYSQEAAIDAIAAASRGGVKLEGRGPFLIAWSPPDSIGQRDVFLLALDLTQVNSFEQAQALFAEWYRDIEMDFDILANGFTLERLRVSIRRWADTYGDGFLRLLQAG